MNSSSELEIIAHFPLEYNDIYESTNELFIKNTTQLEIEELREEINLLNKELEIYKIEENNMVDINSNNSSKCWWCKHSFNTAKVELPELYIESKFYCIGQFCSYNCAKSYNNDLNDENVAKRKSLLHYHYKLTYDKNINIKSAPSWKLLKEFGGILNIKKFRKNFICPCIEYEYLQPPLVSRYSQVEVNNKKSTKTNNYVLKRSKPIKTSKYSLEKSMGLKIINNN